jgi:hypothetical protein
MTWKELSDKLQMLTPEQLAHPVTNVVFGDVVGWPTSLEIAPEGNLADGLKPGQPFLFSE